MKRFFAMSLALLLVLGLLAGCTPAVAPAPPVEPDPPPAVADPPPAVEPVPSSAYSFTAGTYYAKTAGLWDDITVQVVVSDTEIKEIFVVQHHETSTMVDVTAREMIPKIREFQTLNVDTVAGATYTSGAVLTAVRDCLTQAGGDINALMATPAEYPVNTEDQVYDVVVVGGGVAGMSSAISLGRDSDLNVLLLEALAYTGGSGMFSGGAIWATGSRYSTLHANNWDEETLLQLTAERSQNAVVNEALIRKVAQISGPYFDYLVDNNVSWNYGVLNTMTVRGPSPVGYFGIHFPLPGHAGLPIMQSYERIAIENGAEIRFNSKVIELVVNNGAVEGVVVQNKDGSTYTVSAKKVVLATGGFGRNQEYMELYNPNYAGHEYGGSASSMGDAITMTKDLGTYIVNEGISGASGVDGLHSWVFWGGAAGGYNNNVPAVPESGINPGGIFVDVEGNTFTAPNDLWTVKDKTAYYITGGTHPNLRTTDQAFNHGFGYRADTLEALADQIDNLDKENFLASMEAYQAERGPMQAPFTAITGRYCYYATLAGIAVDENCQPLVEATGAAIPNLYVTGEAMIGTVMSLGYTCTGSAISYGTYTGKIASDHIIETIE